MDLSMEASDELLIAVQKLSILDASISARSGNQKSTLAIPSLVPMDRSFQRARGRQPKAVPKASQEPVSQEPSTKQSLDQVRCPRPRAQVPSTKYQVPSTKSGSQDFAVSHAALTNDSLSIAFMQSPGLSLSSWNHFCNSSSLSS